MPPRRKLNISRAGKPFEEEIERSFKHLQEHTRIVWERFYDVSDYVGRSCPKCHAPIRWCSNPTCKHEFPRYGMMPPKRKADFYALYKGVYHLIECKGNRGNGIPVTQLSPEQQGALVENTLNGGISLLFLCDRQHPRKPVLYIVRIQDWVNATQSRVYMKWEHIEAIAEHTIERTMFHGKPYFELGAIFRSR